LRVTSIDDHTLGDLFEPCRACVYWERPVEHQRAAPEEAERLKAEWFRHTAAEFGRFLVIIPVDNSAEGAILKAAATGSSERGFFRSNALEGGHTS